MSRPFVSKNKNQKKKIKETIAAGDVIAGSTGETAFERRVAQRMRRTAGGAAK